MANNSVQSEVVIADTYIVSDSPCGRVICRRLARPAHFLNQNKMEDQRRKRPSKGYYKQLSFVTSELLELSKKKKKASTRGIMYTVERVISRRTADGKVS